MYHHNLHIFVTVFRNQNSCFAVSVGNRDKPNSQSLQKWFPGMRRRDDSAPELPGISTLHHYRSYLWTALHCSRFHRLQGLFLIPTCISSHFLHYCAFLW